MSKDLDLNLLNDLQKIGLSDKEAMVYMLLLTREQMSPIALSRELALHRQYVYNALASLRERGLVVPSGTRKARWKAQSPRKLIVAIEEQASRTERTVEQLMALQGEKKGQEFEVAEGIAAFRALQLASIRKAPPKSVVSMICGEWDMYFERAGAMHAEWDAIRIAKEIPFRMIGPESLAREMDKSAAGAITEYRTLPHLGKNLVNTMIYDNEVVTEVYGQPHLTFSVTNMEVATSQRNFFEALWNLATPSDT
jgi:predicted DNA-binding transcriptional regulator